MHKNIYDCVLPIFVILSLIASVALNLEAMIFGYVPGVAGFAASALHLCLWIAMTAYILKKKLLKSAIASHIFWAVVLISCVLLVSRNYIAFLKDAPLYFFLLPVLPFYGFGFLGSVQDAFTVTVFEAVLGAVSLVMSVVFPAALRKNGMQASQKLTE